MATWGNSVRGRIRTQHSHLLANEGFATHYFCKGFSYRALKQGWANSSSGAGSDSPSILLWPTQLISRVCTLPLPLPLLAPSCSCAEERGVLKSGCPPAPVPLLCRAGGGEGETASKAAPVWSLELRGAWGWGDNRAGQISLQETEHGFSQT